LTRLDDEGAIHSFAQFQHTNEPTNSSGGWVSMRKKNSRNSAV
jgi:hypothetical protein